MAFNPSGYCPPYTGSSSSNDVGSVVDLPPHSATLGLRFYDGEMFPPEYALVRSGCSIAIPPFLELKYLTQLYCCCSW